MKIRKHFHSLFFLIPLYILLLYFLIQSSELLHSDFANNYFGSKFLINGWFEKSIYQPLYFNTKILQNWGITIFSNYSPNTPFISIFVLPVSFLDYFQAKIIFNLFSVVLFSISIYRVSKFYKIEGKYLLLIPIIFFTPLKNNLYFGQMYLVLCAFLLEGYLAFNKRNYLVSSLFWSTCIFLKVFPILLFFYLIAKKEWKAASYLTFASVSLLLFSFAITGTEIWIYYFFEVLPKSNSGEIINNITTHFQSGLMLIKALFIYDGLNNPDPIISSPAFFILAIIFFKSIIIGSCLIITKKVSSNDLLIFGLWIIAGLIIIPVGSSYSLILLVPIYVAIVHGVEINKSLLLICIMLLFLISNLPIYLFIELPLLFQFPRLYLILIFYFIIVSQLTFKLDFKILIPVFFLIVASSLLGLKKKETENHYVLKKDKHVLIYDYRITENHLAYHFWGDKGGEEYFTDIEITSYNTDNLEIRNNQIYYKDAQLTHSKDLKLKPCLIDNKEIYFLSDMNRGIGFFTLRKIEADKISL